MLQGGLNISNISFNEPTSPINDKTEGKVSANSKTAHYQEETKRSLDESANS